METLVKKIIDFRDDRNWQQFHNPKDLAISLNLEASELLENFQWLSSEEAVSKNIKAIKEELADTLIYSILLANELNLDIEEIILDKLAKNEKKYPIEKAFGSNKKYTEFGE
ncbi:nucleotide pyrophosphohydrolase [Cytobacillus dafuensis]|uniref:Nucleotide pyrophosphohydrolase n=1 Tax=Cytobacillus dafuensis TaxID=1742359 RepID=A0A5B8Z2B8_CYTDA|nr:nucleotide pyrophosphohydrolase [Cytobacillus dafuensis]QED47011.1 nucleotide pyrophosphohydrolase [Cytobacillus dafuensis]